MAEAHFLLVCVALLSQVTGYPDGPPESACVDMLPGIDMGAQGVEGHTEMSQNLVPTYGRSKIPPYFLPIYEPSRTYVPPQTIQVGVVADQRTGHVRYQGLIMQARKLICADENGVQVEDDPIGTFNILEPVKNLLKTMKCGDRDHSTACHESRQWKINETVEWIAPDESAGNLIFKATIVQDMAVHWTDVYSEILYDPYSPPPPGCGAATLTVSTSLCMAAIFMIVKNLL